MNLFLKPSTQTASSPRRPRSPSARTPSAIIPAMAFASSPVDSPSSSFFAAAAAAPDLDGLAQAPASVARAILVALCDDRRVRAQALRQLERLLRFEADVREEEEEDGAKKSPNSISSPSNPKKRKATGEPKICVQCDGIFTSDENSFGSCWYHSGKQASRAREPSNSSGRRSNKRLVEPLHLLPTLLLLRFHAVHFLFSAEVLRCTSCQKGILFSWLKGHTDSCIHHSV